MDLGDLNVMDPTCPDQEKEIEPVNRVVSEANPRLYETVKDYDHLYLEEHKLRKRPLEATLL